ncbi:MAG: universal stress protein [Alphaproteobacteria bacterium]|nr:universal stress protein [Alphaproteobacteria bacterium]
MSYSSIMVHLDLDQPNDARLQIAGELAGRFEARLIGIAAGVVQPLYFAEGAAAESFLEKDRAAIESRIAACEAAFRAALKGHSQPLQWRSALDRPGDYVAEQARAADLIVVAGHREWIDPLRQVDAGELALTAGRPILVVPPGITRLGGQKVLIAWKDTREARRAVSDALPMLHKATEVVVAEISERDAERPGAKDRVADVAAWLRQRGIPAASIATKALIGVPEQIDIIAQDEGADLIVAGAYGHSRLREWIFGGVTHGLLSNSKRCVLLGH